MLSCRRLQCDVTHNVTHTAVPWHPSCAFLLHMHDANSVNVADLLGHCKHGAVQNEDTALSAVAAPAVVSQQRVAAAETMAALCC